MNKYFLLLGIMFVSQTLVALEFKADERVADFVTCDQKITPVVQDLFKLLEVPCDGSLLCADVKAREFFRRQIDPKNNNMRREPWTKPESPFDGKFEQALPLFMRMNLFAEVSPQRKEYDYAILLGGCLRWMRQRLASLIKAWDSGVRFKQIVVFTGDRARDLEYENVQELSDQNNGIVPIKTDWKLPNVLPCNETGLVQLLFEQTCLPVGFAALSVTIIDASKRILPDGSLVRPNTRTTIETWLEKSPNPVPGSCLVASSQPFVTYQDVVMRFCVPSGFTVETIGSAIHHDDKTIATLLDVVSLTLTYQLMRLGGKI